MAKKPKYEIDKVYYLLGKHRKLMAGDDCKKCCFYNQTEDKKHGDTTDCFSLDACSDHAGHFETEEN